MKDKTEKTEELVIVGSGPAGLTAAIYTAREDLAPIVISGRAPGGQLMLTTEVDDYPGFPKGVLGPQLMHLFRAQAERFGTRFIEEELVSVKLKKRPFTIRTETQTVHAKAIIIATGASARWLDLPSEQRLIGRGVSACAVCDGPFFRDKRVIVVGGGDTAMREAQHLSKFASRVIVVHRRGEMRAKEALRKLVADKTNVEFLLYHAVEEVLGSDKVTGVRVKNTQNGEISVIEAEGIFIAIGHHPNTSFLKGQLELNKEGYIVVKDETKTSIAGVFIAGDVADFKYRQAVTAAGSGAKAALDAEEYLDKL